MSFFFTLASNNCDSRIPRESLRFSICLESWSSCRLVRVQDLDLANLLETRIICMLPPPGGALYTSYAYAYEEPLRLLESVRRHRSPDAAGAALDRVARDSRSRAAGIPRAMLLDRKLQAGKSRYFCCQRRDRCQTKTYAADIIRAAFKTRDRGYRIGGVRATPGFGPSSC